MAKYDLESFVTDLSTFLQANLNTQIAALNTEKGGVIQLATVGSNAYFIQTLTTRDNVANPYVLIEEATEPKFQGSGNTLAVTYGLCVWVILEDTGIDANMAYRLYRYRRVLTDLFEANWNSVRVDQKLKITATTPTPNFKEMGIDMDARAIGIELQVTITD